MKFLHFKLFRIITLLAVVGMLITQTNAIQNFFKPNTAFAVGDLTVDWGIGIGDVGPIFTVNNMAPGDSETRNVIITNGAPTIRPVAIKGANLLETDALSSVMDIEITDGVTTLYSNTLQQFFIDSLNPSGIPLRNQNAGQSKTYSIIVSFQEGAGNEFQDQELSFDLIIGIGIDIPAECENIDLTGKFPIFGTAGNDRILGTSGDDVIFAFEGKDRVFAHGGNDCIIGGLGNDELRGETGNDFIFGNEGNDLLVGAVGNDIIFGGIGGDTIRGEDGKDILNGEDGNDTITGGNGNDTITGGNNNDTMNGENGTDSLHGDSGNDTLIGGNGPDALIGDAGIDSANGQAGPDTCVAEIETSCEL